MSKHTPGPWKDVPAPGAKWITSADGKLIAVVLIQPSVEHDNSDADSALIATAPELLAALEGLLDQMRKPPNAGDYHRLDLNPSLDAIAKAKGQSK